MPIATQGTPSGCSTLIIGALCLEHDRRATPVARRTAEDAVLVPAAAAGA